MDYDSVLRVLPPGAGWVNLVIAVVYAAVATSLTVFVAGLTQKKVEPDAHWTERARQLWPSRLAGAMAGWLPASLFAVNAWVLAGPLSWLPPPGLSIVTLVATGSVAILQSWPQQRRVRGGFLTLHYYLAGKLTVVLLLYAPLPGLLVMALTLPANGLALWISLGLHLSVVAFLCLGGNLTIARMLGLIEPAEARLAELTREAGVDHGVVPRTFVAKTPMANAVAFPLRQAIVFTDRAVCVLDEDELVSVAHHELSHLAEPRLVSLARFLPVGAFALIAAWRPIYYHGGLAGLAVAAIAMFAMVLFVTRLAHKMEKVADSDAREHHDGQVYARALEKIYQENRVPAVLPGKRKVHPDLYDRLLAAGVTPGYERPSLPPKSIAVPVTLVVTVILALVPTGARLYLGSRSWSHEGAAEWAILVTGGSTRQFGALADHRREDRPAEAVPLYWAALQGVPSRPLNRIHLASCLLDLGRVDDAAVELAHARRAYEARPALRAWIGDELRATERRLARARAGELQPAIEPNPPAPG